MVSRRSGFSRLSFAREWLSCIQFKMHIWKEEKRCHLLHQCLHCKSPIRSEVTLCDSTCLLKMVMEKQAEATPCESLLEKQIELLLTGCEQMGGKKKILINTFPWTCQKSSDSTDPRELAKLYVSHWQDKKKMSTGGCCHENCCKYSDIWQTEKKKLSVKNFWNIYFPPS